ncbi:hypothetical protein V5799_000796 [Amblyomma americanum]|uniref:Uncharacterized protein n=1 Tax=Amblyomma americanum TaxID=6943 RepID=A0AAQ4D213_AMBAM
MEAGGASEDAAAASLTDRPSWPACSRRKLRFPSYRGNGSRCLTDVRPRPKPWGLSMEAGGASEDAAAASLTDRPSRCL